MTLHPLLLSFLLIAVAWAGCVEDTETDPVTDPVSLLSFRPAVDLGSKAQPGAFGTSCQDSVEDGDCGLGEPTLEVAGDGSIYISGVCCVTVAPPVYVSRDGGETFEELRTGDGVRERFGIEGDFAIDAAGRVYFADIELAGTFQVTVWDKDGQYIRHTKWPAPPLVDRDWVRAEGDGTVYYIYNTGPPGTRVYKSTDAAQTFTADAIHVVPYALGNTAIHPGKELCLFGGSVDGFRSVDCSTDGGDTWTHESSSLEVGNDAYPVGAFAEDGTFWLGEASDDGIQVVSRSTAGEWSEPVTVSPPGTHRMPWLAAGAGGAVALAWYGTPDEQVTSASQWYLYVAASQDADAATATWEHAVADPEPVFVGELGRDLLDFLQVEIGPEGSVHVGYSKQRPGQGPDGNEEQLQYVRSEPSALAATDYFWGPQSSTG